MLRCKLVAPLVLDPEEVDRRRRRYERLAGTSIAVTLVNLSGAEAPRRLDDAADIQRSAELVRHEIDRTDPGEFDVVMPDCVLDPCVDEIGETPVPLYGILRVAAGTLAALGARFAAVTRNAAIGEELRRKLTVYGLGESLAALHVLDADFALIADDAGWTAAMAQLLEVTGQTGVGYLLNGCSAVDVQPAEGVARAVDPTRLALSVLAAAGEGGVLPIRSHPCTKGEAR